MTKASDVLGALYAREIAKRGFTADAAQLSAIRELPLLRAELVSLSQVAGARVADIGRDAITFEFVGRPDEVEAFEELVRPYGVRELVRTGRIGLRRPSAGARNQT